jgi:L-ascorbate metabolism protein UlaG (beta-lactamase superfamily)
MHLPKTLLIALLALTLGACSTVNPYYDARRAHHRPDGFVNSDTTLQIGTFPWYEIMQRRLRGDFRPSSPPDGGYEKFIADWTTPINTALLFTPAATPRITWLGHAGMLLQIGEQNILIDPQLSDAAGPVSWLSAKRRVPVPIQPAQLPRIDLVLISHNHFDHLDTATIKSLISAGQKPHFLVPLGVKAWFDDLEIGHVTEMDWWDSRVEGALKIHFTPAQHWSRRTISDTNTTLWGGFAIEWSDQAPRRFLYTGDTGYSHDFKEIRRRLGAVDFLAIPVGAYLPRDFMAPQHINPEDAVQIMLDLDAKHGLGLHWGTFELTQEAFDQPPRDLAVALKQRNLPAERIWLFKHGETRPLPLP